MRKVDGSEALTRVRQLRRDMTVAEKRLWHCLRNRCLGGFKFKRQEWIGPYAADFYCWEARLIVEVDGSQHNERLGYDRMRTKYLSARGFRVLRFWNNHVTDDLDGVLTALLDILRERVPSPSHPAAPGRPLPLPERERGL